MRQYRERGAAGLRKAGRAGRKPLLNPRQLAELEAMLLEGPEAHGFPAPLWTCPRVAKRIRVPFGVRYHEGPVWKPLRPLRRQPAAARRRSARAQHGRHSRVDYPLD